MTDTRFDPKPLYQPKAGPKPPLPNSGSGVEPLPLSPEREQSLEAVLRNSLKTADDLDAAKKEIVALKDELFARDQEIQSLKDTSQRHIDNLQNIIATLESRNLSLQLTHDQGVGQRAQWEALFTSIFSLLRAFQIPVPPVTPTLREEHEVQQAAEQNVRTAHD